MKLIYKNFTAGQGCAVAFPFKLKFVNFLKKFSPERLYYKVIKTRFFLTGKAVIPCLEYVVTTKCTMNCKQCNTFIPYFNDKTHLKHTSFEQFKKDLDKLLKSVDYVDYFGFVGGEPLIDNNLAKKVQYALNKRQIKHVFIASNCTILPSNELLKVMKNKKFKIQISNYNNVKNIKNGITVKHNEFKDLLIRNNISYSNPHGFDGLFQSMPELYKDIQDPAKIKPIHDKCWGLFCNMLCEGEITPCTISVYINRNLELSDGIKEEVVNIRTAKNAKDLTDKLIKYYARDYSQFCHYCHSDNIIYNLPCGEQI